MTHRDNYLGKQSFKKADEYPALSYLVRLYFFQDYDIISEDPDEIVMVFKHENLPYYTQGVATDIERFLNEYGESEAELESAFTRIFDPDMNIYGWNHRTLREALLKIAEIVSDQSNPGKPRPW